MLAVKRALSADLLPDGRPGLFHPDNFSFGQPVYGSRVIAAAQSVQGVATVTLRKFQRLVAPSSTSLSMGVIPIGRLEIARLENSLNFPEHGVLRLALSGGK
jgi:hypothetical protein